MRYAKTILVVITRQQWVAIQTIFLESSTCKTHVLTNQANLTKVEVLEIDQEKVMNVNHATTIQSENQVDMSVLTSIIEATERA